MIFKMKPLNKSGVALVMVLGSLLILTTLAVEFAYNTHIAYELAAAERDRLKAYYLARSALNLIRLELRVERQLRANFAGLLSNMKAGAFGKVNPADPLCKQIPLSTTLLKGLAAAETPEFLEVGGDFEVSCDTEEKKLNLNIFRTAPAAGPEGTGSLYEEQKIALAALLSQKEFDPVFKGAGRFDAIRKVVNAIADWADRDDRINEAPGVLGSSEDSQYPSPQYSYRPKNGKYATVAELLLVAGVGDDIFQKLGPQLTVYGDEKINLCQASDLMIKAFATKWIQTTPGTPPIRPEDDRRWSQVVKAVRTVCKEPAPKPEQVANALIATLSLGSAPNLARQITTTNRFYRVEATGTVLENKVKIVTVLDTGQTNPNFWKTLYYRIE